MDHLERAKRLEEIPLLQKYLAERQVEDRQLWKQQEEERIAQLQEERKVAMLHRDRLMRMREDKEKFVDKLKSERRSAFKEKLAEFEAQYETVRAERLKKRKENRREQRRAQWIKGTTHSQKRELNKSFWWKQCLKVFFSFFNLFSLRNIDKEEAEQRKRDEELKRQREEAERLEQERRAAELEELRKRREAADQVLLKQREREREIEEKQRRREEEGREKEREREREVTIISGNLHPPHSDAIDQFLFGSDRMSCVFVLLLLLWSQYINNS